MNNLLYKNIGKRMKGARKRCGYTIDQVVKETGVSRQSIINYESGNGNPTLRNVLDICNLYKVSPNYLIYGDDNNFSNFTSSLKRKAYSLVALDSDGDIYYDSLTGTIRFNNAELKRCFSCCHAMLSSKGEFSTLEAMDRILQFLEEEAGK